MHELHSDSVFVIATLFKFLDVCSGDNLIDAYPQPAFTFPKLTIETLDQGVKYVQS